jgi:hypothetical protein
MEQQDKPEPRQLLYAIFEYMKSNDFNPEKSLNEGDLKEIFSS